MVPSTARRSSRWLGAAAASWWNAQGPPFRIEEHRVAELVCAEMVANVFSVAVTEGDSVQPGATLLVLESMKMEIPVLSEGGGIVTEVKVQQGDVVQEGDVLVVVA
jgi:acetyl-CoA carboxylase biotin carboxyl carrier protein